MDQKGGESCLEASTRWEPFTDLAEMRSRFDRVFDEWLDGRERVWTPAIDVVRDDDHLVMRADLPGIKPEEVRIEVEDDILTVSVSIGRARRRRTSTTCGATPQRCVDDAAVGVDAKKIEAKTHDGIVEVTIPLPKEAKKEPVRITPTAS